MPQPSGFYGAVTVLFTVSCEKAVQMLRSLSSALKSWTMLDYNLVTASLLVLTLTLWMGYTGSSQCWGKRGLRLSPQGTVVNFHTLEHRFVSDSAAEALSQSHIAKDLVASHV